MPITHKEFYTSTLHCFGVHYSAIINAVELLLSQKCSRYITAVEFFYTLETFNLHDILKALIFVSKMYVYANKFQRKPTWAWIGFFFLLESVFEHFHIGLVTYTQTCTQSGEIQTSNDDLNVSNVLNKQQLLATKLKANFILFQKEFKLNFASLSLSLLDLSNEN